MQQYLLLGRSYDAWYRSISRHLFESNTAVNQEQVRFLKVLPPAYKVQCCTLKRKVHTADIVILFFPCGL